MIKCIFAVEPAENTLKTIYNFEAPKNQSLKGGLNAV